DEALEPCAHADGRHQEHIGNQRRPGRRIERRDETPRQAGRVAVELDPQHGRWRPPQAASVAAAIVRMPITRFATTSRRIRPSPVAAPGRSSVAAARRVGGNATQRIQAKTRVMTTPPPSIMCQPGGAAAMPTGSSIARPLAHRATMATSTWRKKRSSAATMRGARCAGRRSALAGRRQVRTKYMPPTQTTTASTWMNSRNLGSMLETRSRSLEKGDLLGGGCAPEDVVAMRETSEATDHVPVADRPIIRAGALGICAQVVEQRHRALLFGGRLGMLEGQVGEPALGRREIA